MPTAMRDKAIRKPSTGGKRLFLLPMDAKMGHQSLFDNRKVRDDDVPC